MWIKGVRSDGSSRDRSETYKPGDIKEGKNEHNIHYASDVDTAFFHIGGMDSVEGIKFFEIKPLTPIIPSVQCGPYKEYEPDDENVPTHTGEFQSKIIEVKREIPIEELLRISKSYRECYEKQFKTSEEIKKSFKDRVTKIFNKNKKE